jgi:nitroreductase
MNITDAIYRRRAIRGFTDQDIDEPTLQALLQAAVRAPNAMNLQPWAFAVLRDPTSIKEYSRRATAYLLETLEPNSPAYRMREMLAAPDFDLFHEAPLLIVICATPGGLMPTEDCCFAAENLLLAAQELGLATCPVGFSRPWLVQPEVKAELGIPADYVPVIPIIVGHAAYEAKPASRREPEVIAIRSVVSVDVPHPSSVGIIG